nr:uncharacterized protein LOC113709861 [Coffea arabica]
MAELACGVCGGPPKVKKAEEEVAHAENCFDEDPLELHQIRLNERRALLTHAQVQEDMFWSQKARAAWLNDGDKNTRFFHACVSERRRKSVIHRIRSQCGEWLEREDDISKGTVSFFQQLFSDQSGLSSIPVSDVIPKLLSDRDNLELERHPSLEEIKDVVFSLDPDSAAGPDGFSRRFFTFTWEVVGKDVFDALGSFFSGSELPRSITATSIVLIPKGRQLSDNFLLTEELVSGIRRPNRGGNLVLKLDMEKAYDRVSWNFLMQVIRKFGFRERWIDMMWRLVANVWFSVIINGTPKGFFTSSRGLRQGDPISLALFILGAEILSQSLNTLLEDRRFVLFKVSRGCPNISHLAYADDVMIFNSELKSSLTMVMNSMEAYCKVSGQQVNL